MSLNRTEYTINKSEISEIEIDFSADLQVSETLTASTRASLVTQGLTFTSVEVGTTGNALSIILADPGALQATTVFSVVGSVITVSLSHDGAAITATAASVVADFANAPSSVTDLVTISGTATDILTAAAEADLTGGVDNTVITCVDSSVLVPVDAISKISNLPATVNGSGVVTLLFANGEENKTYRIDVTNMVSSGRRIHKRVYVSIYG